MSIKRTKWETYAYISPAIFLVILFIYLPVAMNILYSFTSFNAFTRGFKFVGLKNYSRMFNDTIVWKALWNNTLYAIISVVFQIFLSLIVAAILEYGVFRKFQGFFRSVFFLPSIMSLTVIGLLWQMLYSNQVGIINAFLRIIGLDSVAIDWLGNSKTAMGSIIAVSQWQYTGYTMLLFLVAIQKIPFDLYEAARIDGANPIQQFLHVTVPLVRSMTLVNLVTTVVGAYKVFDEVFVMTGGGPGNSTEVLTTYLYRKAFNTNEMGYASTIAVMVFVVTILFSIVQIRFYNFDQNSET